MKPFANLLVNDESLKLYNEVKIEPESIYDHIEEGVRIKSKCDWHKHGEKSSKFFLNLEKQCRTQSKIRKLISGNVKIVDKTEISKQFNKFYQKLYEKTLLKSETKIETFLDGVEALKLPDTQK